MVSLCFLIGLVLGLISIYGGGLKGLPLFGDHEIVKNIPTASPSDEPLPNEEEAAQVELEDGENYDPMLSTDKDRYTSSEIEPLAPEEDKTVKYNPSQKLRAINIPLENVAGSMGAVVEVTLIDGSQYLGTLVNASEDSLSIEQITGGGTVSYEYTFDKIKSVVRHTKPKPKPKPELEPEPELELEQALETDKTFDRPASQ